MIIVDEPRCPTCGGTLISTSHFDVEDLGNKLAMSVVGACDHCGNQYEWIEYYTYLGHSPESITQTEIKARAF